MARLTAKIIKPDLVQVEIKGETYRRLFLFKDNILLAVINQHQNAPVYKAKSMISMRNQPEQEYGAVMEWLHTNYPEEPHWESIDGIEVWQEVATNITLLSISTHP